MSEAQISIENLSKRYRVGVRQTTDTLAGHLKNFVTYPIRNYKRITQLSNFKDEDDPSIVWALKDINLEINKGDVLGVIGHNGAGKSTLLKIISRITEPTKGLIRVKGRVSSLLEVGTGFHHELTGRENIYMNGTILGMRKKEIDDKFDQIVDFSGVEKYIDTPVKFYSSGMTLRLAFSVAAHLEPEILVIDEVLAVGDAEFQKKCLGKMEDVANTGRTILFVSHSMGSVAKLCNQAVMLSRGAIQKFDHPLKAIEAYMNSSAKTSAYSNPEGVVKKIFISTDKDEATSEVLHNLPVVLNMIIDVTKEMKDYVLVITLLNTLKHPVFTVHKDLLEVTSGNTGQYLFKLSLPSHTITPGAYSFDIKINSAYWQSLQQLKDICSFQVIDAGSRYSKWEHIDYGSVFMDHVPFEAEKA